MHQNILVHSRLGLTSYWNAFIVHLSTNITFHHLQLFAFQHLVLLFLWQPSLVEFLLPLPTFYAWSRCTLTKWWIFLFKNIEFLSSTFYVYKLMLHHILILFHTVLQRIWNKDYGIGSLHARLKVIHNLDDSGIGLCSSFETKFWAIPES